MVALWNRADDIGVILPMGGLPIIGQIQIQIIFLPCNFYLLLLLLSSPNLSGHRLDVYHTSTHGVALVRI